MARRSAIVDAISVAVVLCVFAHSVYGAAIGHLWIPDKYADTYLSGLAAWVCTFGVGAFTLASVLLVRLQKAHADWMPWAGVALVLIAGLSIFVAQFLPGVHSTPFR